LSKADQNGIKLALLKVACGAKQKIYHLIFSITNIDFDI